MAQQKETSEFDNKLQSNNDQLTQKDLKSLIAQLLQCISSQSHSSVSPEAVEASKKVENISISESLKSTDESNLDKQIESLYASNMSISEIAEQLSSEQKLKITAEFINTRIEKSVPEFHQLQNSHLQSLYPLIYIDKCDYATCNPTEKYGNVGNILYSIFGVNKEGFKECLGFWSCRKKNSSFWIELFTELKNRGVQDILFLLSSEESSELKKVIKGMYPETLMFPSPGHIILQVCRCVNCEDEKYIRQSLKSIWLSTSQQEGNKLMEQFCAKWQHSYPLVVSYLSRLWPSHSTSLAFGDQILREFVFNPSPVFKYSIAIKSALIHKGSMPSQLSARKLAYLATRSICNKWTVKIRHWCYISQSLGVTFGDRFLLFD